MNIVVTGSIAYDYIMSFPGYFKDHVLAEKVTESINLSFLVDTMVRRRGGVASNIAYSLALLGERPVLLGAVGQDFDDYREWMESHGIDTSAVKQFDDVFTASFFCNTDRAQNQIASFYNGAMARSGELSLYDVNERSIDMVVISPNDPEAMKRYVRECKEMGLPYLYDVSWQIVRLTDEELHDGIDGAYVLVVNEYEFEMIRKRTGWSEEDTLNHAQNLIVTLGERGSMIVTPEDTVHVSPVPTDRAIDAIGIGDAYRAGLLKGLALGLSWASAGRIGSLAATYVLESAGPQEHFYEVKEFVERFRQNFDDEATSEHLLRAEQSHLTK